MMTLHLHPLYQSCELPSTELEGPLHNGYLSLRAGIRNRTRALDENCSAWYLAPTASTTTARHHV